MVRAGGPLWRNINSVLASRREFVGGFYDERPGRRSSSYSSGDSARISAGGAAFPPRVPGARAVRQRNRERSPHKPSLLPTVLLHPREYRVTVMSHRARWTAGDCRSRDLQARDFVILRVGYTVAPLGLPRKRGRRFMA